jgi:hypothetical protein
MGVGVSIVVAAIGAILRWAVTTTSSHGFNVHTVGIILLIVGIIGFIVSLAFWNSWGGFRGTTYRRRTVRRSGDPVAPVTYEERERF